MKTNADGGECPAACSDEHRVSLALLCSARTLYAQQTPHDLVLIYPGRRKKEEKKSVRIKFDGTTKTTY